MATDLTHLAAASILRQQYLHGRTSPSSSVEVDVEVADLSAYDAVFGTGEVA